MSLEIINEDFFNVDYLDNSMDLIITSPPYDLGKDYEGPPNEESYRFWLDFTATWMDKCYKILKPDGRICVNIPLDKNKGGQQAVYADFLNVALYDTGLKYFTTIVWHSGNLSRRTAWGSWKSSSCPYVTAPVEMIVVLYKESKKKLNKGESDITRDEFIAWTNGVWTFPGESKKRIGHPAPFPLELPKRLIKLYSYVGDTVLDPFAGSGTTLLACKELNRHGFGCEIDEEYFKICTRRLY